MFNKRAISPVVATALLLVVAVTAVIGFNSWFSAYQTNVFSGVELQSRSQSLPQIQNFVGGLVYIKSGSTNISAVTIRDKQGVPKCTFTSEPITSSGLVGWWSLDDLNGTIKDKSGSNNNGKFYSTTRVLWDFESVTGGIIRDRTAYSINSSLGSNQIISSGCLYGSCMRVGSELLKNTGISVPVDGLTMSAWVKNISFSGGCCGTVFGINSVSWNRMFQIDIYPSGLLRGRVDTSIQTNQCPTTSYTINSTRWTHLVLTWSNTTKNASIYANGVRIGTRLITGVPEFNHNIVIEPLNAFLVDELSIYSKAFSDSEIQALYQAQRAKFIEFVPTSTGLGVNLNGVSDYIDLGNVNFLEGTDKATIIAKFKSVDSSANIIYSNGWDGIDTNSFALMDSGGGLRSYFATGPATWAYTDYLFSAVDTDRIVVSTYNGSVFNMYIDGQLVDSKPLSGSLNVLSSNMYLGKSSSVLPSGYHFLNGVIDEIKIYNRPLTVSEIRQLTSTYLLSQSNSIISIDTTSCNLDKGQEYEVMASTISGTVNKFIVNK